jgi:hypothetical protein
MALAMVRHTGNADADWLVLFVAGFFNDVMDQFENGVSEYLCIYVRIFVHVYNGNGNITYVLAAFM